MKNNSKADFCALTSINAFPPETCNLKKTHSCLSDVKTKTIYALYIGEIVHAYVKTAPMVFPRSVICMEFAWELNNACGKERPLFPYFMMKFQYLKYFFPSWAKEILHHPVPDNASIDFIEICLCTTAAGICLTNSKASHQDLVRS